MNDQPVGTFCRVEPVKKEWATRTSRLSLFAAWGFLVLYAGAVLRKPLTDPDLFWQLAAGREMLEHHRFLSTDVFSYPFFGKPWINTEWLFELGAYPLEKYAGLEGLYWAKIITSSLVLLVMGWVIREAGARGGRWFLLTTLGVMLLESRLLERAELITLLFLGVELFLLLRVQKRPSRWFPWIMAGLVALWVNFHGGSVYGVGLLALFNVGARWARAEASLIKVMGQALLLSGLALLFNPYGWRLLLFYRDVLGQAQGELHNIIVEWKRPTLHNAPVYWGVFLLSGVVMVDGFLREKNKTVFWIPAALVFAVWTSLHLRSTALYAFVALPMAAGWRKTFRWGQGTGWEGFLVLVGVLLLSYSSLITKWVPSDLGWFPVRACSFVQKMELDGRMYNTYKFGGYLQWKLGPGRKTFMDGRYLSYPLAVKETDVLTELLSKGDGSPWARWLMRYGIDYAVTDYMDSFWKVVNTRSLTPEIPYFDRLFPPQDWALVFWDDAAMVFVRRIPRWTRLVQEHEYRALKPYRTDRFTSPFVQTQEFTHALHSELARHRSEVNSSNIRMYIESLMDADKTKRMGYSKG